MHDYLQIGSRNLSLKFFFERATSAGIREMQWMLQAQTKLPLCRA
jgi:hypothetical protein